MFEVDHRSVERTGDGAFRLRWRLEGSAERVSIHTGVSPDSIDFDRALIETHADSVRVEVEAAARRPYFALATETRHRLVVAERRIPLDGARNFRDLGGYATADGRRVRWGALYRSDHLGDLSAADEEAVSELALGLVCDLRGLDERRAEPDRLTLRAPARSLGVPVDVDAGHEMEAALNAGERDPGRLREIVRGGYRSFADRHRGAWSQVFQEVLDSAPGAVLVHCAAGQDRTGIVAALLLLAVGVPAEVVTADYMLTAVYGTDPTEFNDPLLAAVWRAGPDLLEASFEAMRASHGSIDVYLQDAIGIDERAREALRARLLAKAEKAE